MGINTPVNGKMTFKMAKEGKICPMVAFLRGFSSMGLNRTKGHIFGGMNANTKANSTKTEYPLVFQR
jgi:hypothetical protein